MALVLNFTLEDFGICNHQQQLTNEKDENLKLQLASSVKKSDAYLQVLKTLDKILPD